MHASPAYVRRLLASRRLFGIKVGPVWGVYLEDLEAFQRGRRPPGRPCKAAARPIGEDDTRNRITGDLAAAGTHDALLKPKAVAPTRDGTARRVNGRSRVD
jgi:hypothetical protein